MNIALEPHAARASVMSAVAIATQRIAPLWPLSRFVAVNPFVGLVDQPFTEACALHHRVFGAVPTLSPAEALEAYRRGDVRVADLAQVAGSEWSVRELIQQIQSLPPALKARPIATVADALDEERPTTRWSRVVVDEIGKWCGAFFDQNQTTWANPWRNVGLFRSWREFARHDHVPEILGINGFRSFVETLPEEPTAAIARCVELIAPTHAPLPDFFHRQLATIAGWAGYAQWLVREEAWQNRKNSSLVELLAIRLTYDAALLHAFSSDTSFLAHWRNQRVNTADCATIDVMARWQAAYDLAFQRRLARSLATQVSATPIERPAIQAVFCIDVRSEPLRRKLEQAHPNAQTIGCAGFFGFPVAHERAGERERAPLAPVLLSPSVVSREGVDSAAWDKAVEAKKLSRAGIAFQNSTASTFSFVETLGLAFGVGLLKRRSPGPRCSRPRPSLVADPARTAAFAEGALRAMSLTQNFARLVMICGHGSQSTNNPHASSLDCGACGGHAGDTNARLAASALNDPDVRSRLASRGIAIPEDTVFVAALHNTATDEITVFDQKDLPPTHQADLSSLQAALLNASSQLRQERAASLGLSSGVESALDVQLRARAADPSQVRPEWGLANNAAFVAAPRSRTVALKLDGRVFLHEYDAACDPTNETLQAILGGPVVVASWINLQYFASRVDPARYAAGDKTIHNIVGGFGVVEGNGGDLKAGLPLQSIHDGEKFIHEPRRLSVFIEAPRHRILDALNAQPAARALFNHGWIHLLALEKERVFRYDRGAWARVAA